MIVTVFTKPICQGCKLTKKKLEQLEIEYTIEELDKESTEYFTSLGLLAAPVVEVDLGFGAKWRWAGHSPSKMETLDHSLSCDDPVCRRCESMIFAA